MPRKTDSNNPADWLFLAASDLKGIAELCEKEISYEMCRSKLAEVVEKLMKAELLRLGWFLEKTHDLQHLHSHLEAKGSRVTPLLLPLVKEYTDVYFMSRYPGFDLEDPAWPSLRNDVKATRAILDLLQEGQDKGGREEAAES